MTCVQEHMRQSCAVEETQPSLQCHVCLSSAEAALYALATGIAEGMVTKHLLKEMEHEVTLVNHVVSQFAKAWAAKRGLRLSKHVMLFYNFVQDVVEKKQQTTLACVNTKTNKSRLDDKVPSIRSAHELLHDAV